MEKNIKCQNKTGANIARVKVKIIKAPVVDQKLLEHVIFARSRALIL